VNATVIDRPIVSDRPLAGPGRSVARLAADHPARGAERFAPVGRQDAGVFELVDLDASLDAPLPRAAAAPSRAARGLRAVFTVAVGMAGGFAIVGLASAVAAASAVVAVLAL
jgi:hypothetical protein